MHVQSERLVLMLAFMIDLHEVLTGASECFQADKTTLVDSDVGQGLEFIRHRKHHQLCAEP